MTLHDGTPRRPYDGPRDSHGNRPKFMPSWKIFAAVTAAVAVLVVLTDMHPFERNEVTNAPSGTPRSTQQPDTTPPVNPEPAQ